MSYYNLESVSRTLASQIWDAIKDDPHLRTIIDSEGQIINELPKDAQSGPAQLSVYLYSVAEIPTMRNQPQPPSQTRALLNLKLRYLVTPLTFNAENDAILLGRVMQRFAEKPVLRGSDLQGSLKEEGDELRITLDDSAVEDLGRLWLSLASPYKLSISYSVFPVKISASKTPEKPIKVIRQPKFPSNVKLQTA